MAFATEDMVKDRLDENGQTAHDNSISRFTTYGHGVAKSILRDAGLDVADVEANLTSYDDFEIVEGAEADIIAGYIIQGLPQEGSSQDLSFDKPHILTSTGIANLKYWAKKTKEASNSTYANKLRVVLNQASSRRDYSSHYS